MRRAAKWIGGLVGGLVALPVLLLLFANTPPGRAAIAWLTPQVTGDSVRLDGLSGRFPDALRAARVELRDARGAYATVDDLVLDWSPLRLLQRRIVIDRLDAARVALLRLPVASSGGRVEPPDEATGSRRSATRAAFRRSITMRRCSNRSGDQSSTRSSTVA